MKDQSPLSAGEIREAFDKARAKARDNMEETGSGKLLQYLSDTIAALQASGADIRLEARANSHSNAFDMMYTVSGFSGGTVDAYGYVKIGETCHLWAIASRHNETSVQRIYLSKNNVVEEGGRNTPDNGKSYSNAHIPGECFDFATDAEALKKLQAKLIKLCADNEVMLENDTGNVFNKSAPDPVISKPSPKLKL